LRKTKTKQQTALFFIHLAKRLTTCCHCIWEDINRRIYLYLRRCDNIFFENPVDNQKNMKERWRGALISSVCIGTVECTVAHDMAWILITPLYFSVNYFFHSQKPSAAVDASSL